MTQNTVPLPADLRLPPRPPSGRRRVETRYQCGPATSGRLVTHAAAEPVRTWILNLSAHGIGLLTSQALEPKSDILVLIRSGTNDKVYELPARVAHCTRQVDGDWMVGCELLTTLTEDDLDALL